MPTGPHFDFLIQELYGLMREYADPIMARICRRGAPTVWFPRLASRPDLMDAKAVEHSMKYMVAKCTQEAISERMSTSRQNQQAAGYSEKPIEPTDVSASPYEPWVDSGISDLVEPGSNHAEIPLVHDGLWLNGHCGMSRVDNLGNPFETRLGMEHFDPGFGNIQTEPMAMDTQMRGQDEHGV